MEPNHLLFKQANILEFFNCEKYLEVKHFFVWKDFLIIGLY